MQENEQTSARERRLARKRAEQIQRMVGDIHLAIHGADDVDALIALNDVLVEKLGRPRPRLRLVAAVEDRFTAPMVKRAAAG